MAGLCEGGNEPAGSLKANGAYSVGSRPTSHSYRVHLSTCVDFGPAFIDIYDVVQRAATRGNPRVKFVIIIIILHELGLCRLVSAPSSSLLKGLPGQKAWVDLTARLEKPTYYGRNDHDFKIKCRKQKTDDGNNALSESAMRISYKICHEIAKKLKTFNEGEFIKRCLIILADELCPQQVRLGKWKPYACLVEP
ncbi:hypothetical protein ANN_14743 [Periplaneta americana]|uniref:Uncharacterized protein n=1 Tax=Periplaneta americana TaxID=6978 RepID=A0ABQ8SX52_PERAM|nr:hypothetical protein ANN_14743 [Periplaneta americana]